MRTTHEACRPGTQRRTRPRVQDLVGTKSRALHLDQTGADGSFLGIDNPLRQPFPTSIDACSEAVTEPCSDGKNLHMSIRDIHDMPTLKH